MNRPAQTLLPALRAGALRLLASIAVVLLASCGSGGSEGSGTASSGAGQVGAAGGRVDGVGGASVEVPAGALVGDTTVRIAQDSTGAPALPEGLRAAGPVYSLTPHGVTFSQPATVRVPFDTTLLTADTEPVLMKAQPGGGWVILSSARREGGVMVAQTQGFSLYVVTVCARNVGGGCYNYNFTADLNAVDPAPVNGVVTVTQPRYVRFEFAFTAPSTAFGIVYELSIASNRTGRLGASRVMASGSLAASPLVLDLPVTAFDQGSNSVTMTISCVQVSQGIFGTGCSALGPGETGSRVTPFTAQSNVLTLQVNIPPGTSSAALAPAIVAQPQDLEVAVGEPHAPFSVETSTAVLHSWQESRDGGSTWTDLGTWPVKKQQGQCIFSCPPPVRVTADPALASTMDLVTDVLAPQALDASANGRLYRAVLANGFGTAVSRSARLSVVAAELPVVVQGPQAQQVKEGQTASYTAVFSGRPAPTVCWERLAPGATTWQATGTCAATYTTASLLLTDNGTQVRAVGSNSAGSVRTDPISIAVVRDALAPAIVGAPQPLSVPAGATALFAAGVNGTAPLSYQWKRNGVAIPGANAPLLTLPAVQPSDDGASFTLLVTNSAGSTTTVPATLTVTAATGPTRPVIVTEPTDVTVSEGSDVTFAVGAVSVDPPTFQWYADSSPIPGATEASFTMRNVTANNVCQFSVRVTNSLGTVTSRSVTLHLTAPVLSAPVIATDPASVVVPAGASATLAVAASGSGPLAYEWRRNGSVVAGATQAVLVLNAIDANSAGSYTVTVSNGAGSATSAAAQVLLLGAPSIGTQPAAATAAEGGSFSFSVGASGQGLRYQWLKNGLAVSGATAATLTGTATLADNGSSFQVLVYNGTGLVFSSTALLTVTPQSDWRPAAVLQPTGSSFHPSVGIDGQGGALAVWHTGLRLAAASGTPSGWSGPAFIDNGQFTNGFDANVAVAANGNAIVAWGFNPGGTTYRTALLARTVGGWAAPLDADDSQAGNSQSARVAVDGSGRGVAVWLQSTGTRYEVFARRFVGGTWQAPERLDPNIAAGELRVTLNPNGVGVVSYVVGGNTELRVVPVDLGTGFAAPQVVRTGAGTIGSAAVAVDGSGGRWAAWIENAPTGGYNLRGARYGAGSWGTASTLQADVGFPLADRFSMAGGAGGHVLVAWVDSQTTRDTLYALRFDPAAGWAARVALSTPGRTGTLLPQAAVDASGRMALVWQQRDASGTRNEIAGRHFDGSTWSAAKALQATTNDLARADQLGLAIGSSGRAVAVWVESAPSGDQPVTAAFWD